MPETSTIRALSRGLAVLRSLETSGPATLHELAAATALPKPTVLRLLRTLEADGYVRRGLGDRLYHRNLRSARPAEAGWKAAIAEVAAPILDRLCDAVLWPSDLGIYERGAIHIQETTRRLSPFLVNPDVAHADIHVLPSAMGRAVLAWSGPARRAAILEALVRTGRRPDALAGDADAVQELVEETIARGYAARRPGYYIAHRREADVSAIARPIMIRGEAVAAVNLAWVSSAHTEREFAARYLPRLSAAASEIDHKLAAAFGGLPLIEP